MLVNQTQTAAVCRDHQRRMPGASCSHKALASMLSSSLTCNLVYCLLLLCVYLYRIIIIETRVATMMVMVISDKHVYGGGGRFFCVDRYMWTLQGNGSIILSCTVLRVAVQAPDQLL